MLFQLGRGTSRARRIDLVPSLDTSDKTVALFGDSISFQNTGIASRFEAYGYMTVLNMLSGQRYNFSHTANKGVSGNSTAQMLARVSDLDALGANLVIVQGGANDITSKLSAASIIANLDAIYDYVTGTLGAKVIAMTMLPRSYWPSFSAGEITQGKTDINTVNDWIRAQASANIIVADPYDAFDNGSDEPNTNYTYDGLHPSLLGAYHMGKVLFDVLEPLYGNRDFTIATGNIFTNTNFSGTGGTLGSNATGQVADGHVVETGGTTNSATRTFSKDGGQKIEFNFGSALSTAEVVRLYHNMTGQSGAVGMNAYYEVELEVISGTGTWYTLSVELRNSSELAIGYDRRDTATAIPPAALAGFTATEARKLLLRTPTVIVPAGTTQLRGRVNIECNCAAAAASGSLRLIREQLRVF